MGVRPPPHATDAQGIHCGGSSSSSSSENDQQQQKKMQKMKQ